MDSVQVQYKNLKNDQELISIATIFLKSPGFIKLDKKCNIPFQRHAGMS